MNIFTHKRAYIALTSLVVLVAAVFSMQYQHRGFGKKAEAQILYEFPTGYTIGTWEWRALETMPDTQIKDIVTRLAEEKVTTMYLDVGSYLDLYESTAPDKATRLATLERKTTLLLTETNARGITVTGLGGATNWMTSTYRYVPLALLDYILSYNKTHSVKFTGMQFDIEFYNDPAFSNNKVSYSQQYLNLAANLVTKVQALSLADRIDLSMAVPFWLGDSVSPVPVVNYAGKKQAVGLHLMKILNAYSRSYLVTMAYRNYTGGVDGSIALAKKSLDQLRARNYSVRLIVGQETSNVEPAKITFYSKTEQDLKRSTNEIATALAPYPQFAGLAIHDTQSFLLMK